MTLKQAIEKFKLDKRRKWFSFAGTVVYDYKYSTICSGCCEDGETRTNNNRGSGCSECGYTGRRRDSVPVPVFDNKNNPIKVTDKDFTRA